MTTLPLPSGGKLIFLPYNLDVSVYPLGSNSSNIIKTIRAEKISLLAISKSKDTGLTTLGIPDDVLGIVTVTSYDPEGSEPTVESVLGDLAISKIRLIPSIPGSKTTRYNAHLSSVTYHGEKEHFLKWSGNLISLGLPECSEIGKTIVDIIGGEPIFSDHIFIPSKNPQLRAYDNVLTKPVHLYLEEYDPKGVGVPPPPPNPSPIPAPELKDQPPTPKNLLDAFFMDMIAPSPEKAQSIDIYDVIGRLNQLGEKPSALVLAPGQRYATMEQCDDHHRRNKDYDISIISDPERTAVLNYFSYVVGMTFWEAENKVRKEGMKLVVGKIVGNRRTKFITTDLRKIKVEVRDPRPVNSECPSENGIITKVMGFVIVTKNGFVE